MSLIASGSKVYRDGYILYNYDGYNYRLVRSISKDSGWELLEKFKDNWYFSLSNKDDVLKATISRAKRNVREVALCNDFNYFVTLTIADKNVRYDVDFCFSSLREILKKIKRKYPEFIYLFICEKHKDGAYHFHGLVNNIYNFYINNNGYISCKYFDNLGFNSFLQIKHDENSKQKISNYITKYITKDFVSCSAGTSYIVSRGVKRPSKEKFKNYKDIENLDLYFKNKFTYENNFCKIYDFNINNLSDKEKVEIISLFNEVNKND